MKNAISWFEIPVADYDRAKSFYEKILAAELVEMDVAGSRMIMLPCDQDPGVVGGALVENADMSPSGNGSIVYLEAEPDLSTILDRIIALGNDVPVPKTQIDEDMGYFAHFIDSEGNRVGLFSKQ